MYSRTEGKVRRRRRRCRKNSRMKKRERGVSKYREWERGRLDERRSERGRENSRRNEEYGKRRGEEKRWKRNKNHGEVGREKEQ
jgi:hypothetical protein